MRRELSPALLLLVSLLPLVVAALIFVKRPADKETPVPTRAVEKVPAPRTPPALDSQNAPAPAAGSVRTGRAAIILDDFGYSLEFDAEGRLGDVRIDFEGLAGFLRELWARASSRGLTLQKVIIAPEYVPILLATPSGRQLGPIADLLSRGPAWVRHDEHFHVDFAVVP